MESLQHLFASIGIDRDYDGMDFIGLAEDLQGWGSEHPVFEHLIRQVEPRIVVEVGSWKGASAIHMARIARKLGISAEFICVDTWLGSNATLWRDAEWRRGLLLRNGYPSMFRQFIFNVLSTDVAASIFPLPMTTLCGCHVLKSLSVVPDLIYLDAGHEELEVRSDLEAYFDLLRPGGWLFGDDYSASWRGVVRAVNRFCTEQDLLLNVVDDKWYVRKMIA